MKLKISHPDRQSQSFVSQSTNNGETLYRSPHVGNVNGEELSLILGLCSIGANVQLELVDTVRGNDSYSQPRVAMTSLQKIVLASNKHAGRIVGSCQPNTEGTKQLKELGIAVPGETISLKQLHIDSLKRVLPDDVRITPSTEFFAQVGSKVYETILRETIKTIDRPLRYVQPTGKIEQATDTASFDNIYGLGEHPKEGLLPPLEAMMAIEVIKQILENEGCDNQLVHIAGPDMIRYTRDEAVMKPVENIINRVLSDLGIPENIYFDYVVPCMDKILRSDDFDRVIDDDTVSQYDILVARQQAEV